MVSCGALVPAAALRVGGGGGRSGWPPWMGSAVKRESWRGMMEGVGMGMVWVESERLERRRAVEGEGARRWMVSQW